MTWREILGAVDSGDSSPSQNTQNTQNTHNAPDPSSEPPQGDVSHWESKLLEALSDACSRVPISVREVRDALGSDDIEDWQKGKLTAKSLSASAAALVQSQAMERGEVPRFYTSAATCRHCGPIWLWFSGEVLGCPWCWNRIKGHPIPRPQSVRCADCRHFEPCSHPHLGHCARGEPEAIAGLWNTDNRVCLKWLPVAPEWVRRFGDVTDENTQTDRRPRTARS